MTEIIMTCMPQYLETWIDEQLTEERARLGNSRIQQLKAEILAGLDSTLTCHAPRLVIVALQACVRRIKEVAAKEWAHYQEREVGIKKKLEWSPTAIVLGAYERATETAVEGIYKIADDFMRYAREAEGAPLRGQTALVVAGTLHLAVESVGTAMDVVTKTLCLDDLARAAMPEVRAVYRAVLPESFRGSVRTFATETIPATVSAIANRISSLSGLPQPFALQMTADLGMVAMMAIPGARPAKVLMRPTAIKALTATIAEHLPPLRRPIDFPESFVDFTRKCETPRFLNKERKLSGNLLYMPLEVSNSALFGIFTKAPNLFAWEKVSATRRGFVDSILYKAESGGEGLSERLIDTIMDFSKERGFRAVYLTWGKVPVPLILLEKRIEILGISQFKAHNGFPKTIAEVKVWQ